MDDRSNQQNEGDASGKGEPILNEELEALLSGLGTTSPGSGEPRGPTVEVAIAKMTTGRFEFPSNVDLEPEIRKAEQILSDGDLLARLRQLTLYIGSLKPDPRDYIQTRLESCAINLVLNRRISVAPAFRPHRRANKPGTDRPISDRWIVGDRAIIDLHWHWMRKAPATGELQALFDAPEFSFEAASEFAGRRLKAATKVDIVGLSEADQLLGTVLRSAAARDRWTTIGNQLKVVRRHLLDLRPHPRYALTADTIAGLEHAARALLLARGSASVASGVIAHVGGVPSPPERLREAKKRLDRLGCVPGGWGGPLVSKRAPGGAALVTARGS